MAELGITSPSMAGRQTAALNNRVLGTVGMLCSPMLFLAGFVGSYDANLSRLGALLGLVFLVGWMCSAFGLRRLKATGNGTAGGVLFCVQIVGLLLASSQQVQDMIYKNPNTSSIFYRIADIAWPFSVVFMLIVGFFTLRAKVWTGWRSFTPLLCGFTLPLFFLVGAVVGRQAGGHVFGVYSVVAWMLLGYAVRSADRFND